MTEGALEWRDFSLAFGEGTKASPIIHGLNLSVERGEVLGLVGVSGSGKSLTLYGSLDLAGSELRLTSGEWRCGGEVFWSEAIDRRHEARGKKVGVVFQNPMSSLNPFLRVASQVAEALPKGLSRHARKQSVQSLLEEVGLPDPVQGARAFPHELSGGMRQRAMIAMALASEPDFLFADEATTALDVTTQRTILALLLRLVRERNLGVVFVTHDLGACAGLADRVAVLDQGRLVECADVATFYTGPASESGQGLLDACGDFRHDVQGDIA